MATKELDKRYIALLNLDYRPSKDLDDSIYWYNDTNHINIAGRVGHLENSLFYMGFSKNYNNINKAKYFPVSPTPTYPGGSSCIVEFSQYDSGYEGPMISKEITVDSSSKSAYKMSWLNISPGKSTEVGIFPVNIALHTYVDNNFIAQEALAQAWLLKDSNYVASTMDAMKKTMINNCVYRYHSDRHNLNKPSCISGLTAPQNKILYNAFSAFRKHTYYKNYKDYKDSTIDVLYSSAHKDHEAKITWHPIFKDVPKMGVWPLNCTLKNGGSYGVNAKDCMNYYDTNKTYDANKNGDTRGDNIPICVDYESKSYGGGYVSLHHIHFTTVGNTTTDSYTGMCFYIPRSTGEAATKIRLIDGEYDETTNTTHYWVYFFINIATNKEFVGEFINTNSPGFSDGGWSYDSPINIPVGKVYSKITPMDCISKAKNVSEFSEYIPTTNDYLESIKNPDLSKWGITTNRYIASFTTSFNIYIVKEKVQASPQSYSLSAGTNNYQLTYPDLMIPADPNATVDGGTTSNGSNNSGNLPSVSERPRIPSITDTSIISPSEEDLIDNNDKIFDEGAVDDSTGQYTAVQICSITGVLSDYTWAYSHMRSHYRNLYREALYRGINPGSRSDNKLDAWDRYIESPKLYGLLVLQHCCGMLNWTTNDNKSTMYGSDDSLNNAYSCNIIRPGDNGKFNIVSSFEEGQMILNNGSSIKTASGKHYSDLLGNSSIYRWLGTDSHMPSANTNGIDNGTHNIIKVANHNAKYSLKNVSLITPSCHNRGLYPSVTNYDVKSWYKNHIDDSSIIDCGVNIEDGEFKTLDLIPSSHITKNTNKKDKRWTTTISANIDTSTLLNTNPNLNDEESQSVLRAGVIMHRTDYDLSNANLPAVTGKLGKLNLKIKAQFSIVKDSIMINGIPLNKMATKFPLEHRDSKIKNIITFKLEIDFTKGPGRLSSDRLPNITDSDKNVYVLPTYTLYDEDLKINAVGNLKEIILPTNYSDTFPYYNVSLRLPLTSIDDNFCKYIGNNKFLGATCYDLNETYYILNESDSSTGDSSIDSSADSPTGDSSISDSSIYIEELKREKLLTNTYVKGIKYEFKILEISKKITNFELEKETLTCAITFFNDDNTFGFLDFSFAIPTYKIGTDSSLNIEGTAVLSDMMNKIIIKGVPVEENNFVFSESEFNTSIKKSLNTDVANTLITKLYEGSSSNESSNDNLKSEDDIFDNDNKVTGEDDEDTIEMMYSDENGVMNVQDAEDDESEVRIKSKNVVVVNRSTGEVQGVGNDSFINYNDYGKYVGFENKDTAGNNTLYPNKGYGMYNIKGRCLTNDFLPLLSNKIIVY